MTSMTSLDAAIRVVVTPSQSSYFAGEPFSVTITFTNTRTPDSVPPRTVSHTHKRAAHSISSAPIARPPTSPGTPRAATPSIPSQIGPPSRRHLVGKTPQPVHENGEAKLSQSRSLSVSIAPHELEAELRRSVLQEAVIASSSQGLARSPSLPLAPNHPHARKHSLFDGQVKLAETSPSTPLSPSATNSTFSLSLDPISETSTTSPIPETPLAPSPLIEGATVTFPFASPAMTHSYPPRRPTNIGLGRPPDPPRTAFSSTFPQRSNAEIILYSYAQLTGTLHVTPLPGTNTSPDQAYALNYVRSALLKRSGVGGGSMDITSMLRQPTPTSSRPPARRSHSRSSSISSGIMSLFSPSASTPSLRSPLAPTHKGRTMSMAGAIPGSAPPEVSTFPKSVGLGIGISDGPEEDIDPESPLPTLDEQPSMLAVDLSLLPGESRSYAYSVVLPENLPPTYKGRTFRFSYELVVGTCRAGAASKPSSGSGSISRVMKVPIRIYNHVSVNRPPRPYDLLWPVGRRIKSPAATVVEQTVKLLRKPHSSEVGTFEDLQRYSQKLLQRVLENSANGDGLRHHLSHISEEEDHLSGRGMMPTESEGGLSGCREAVEILTRIPKKASYDVNKDGVKVAVLTFPKSSYRLGETVLGVVELNDRTGRSKVLKLSAVLEAQESLPASISPPSASRHLRRVHAEHYSSFVASTLRTTFSLDIPSDASPAFQIDLGDHQQGNGGSRNNPGGLEWKVRLCLLVGVASEACRTGTEGVRMKALVRDGPRGEWGSSWCAPSSLAPMEKPDLAKLAAATSISTSTSTSTATATPPNGIGGNRTSRSWAASIFASILGSGEREYHDGDDEGELDEEEAGEYDGIRADKGGGVGVGVVFGGGEEGWRDLKVEMVECEVPIKVWPGNTAFKAVDVVFEV